MKFCNQCKKEINTNANYCAMCGNQLIEKKKKDASIVVSIISLILFLLVVLAIVFATIVTIKNPDNPATGFVWAFMVIIPAIPLLGGSTILSIVGFVLYFKTIKSNSKKTTKTVLLITNIIQMVLVVVGLILFVRWWTQPYVPTEEGLDYTVQIINEMFIESDNKDASNEVNINNVHKFDQLLGHVDTIVGKNNYYIGSLYIAEIPHDDYAHYVVKIIPKDYIEQYNSWTGSFSSNPYLIMFTMETEADVYSEYHQGMYDNYYQTFILGMKYEEDLKNEFSNINSEYKYLADYNTLLYISANNLGIKSESTWQDGLNMFSSKSKANLPTMLIVAPSGTTEEDGQKFIDDNKEIFDKYYVNGLTLCILKENESITDYINISKYDDVFETYYSYRID